ncbi:MAG: hypothetical protein WCO84_02455 [bacterium]
MTSEELGNKTYPTVNDFVEYFKKNPLTDKERWMLLLNYFSPDNTITSKIMGAAMGWKIGGSNANLPYGKLAGKIAEQMNYQLPNPNYNVSFLADFPEEAAIHWRMRPELVEAIHLLNWDTIDAKRKAEDELSTAEIMLM